MYRQDDFRSYFVGQFGASQGTFNTYNSYLNRIDQLIGGLDERIAADGIEAVREWGSTQSAGPFENYPSQARSVLKRYLQFAFEANSTEVSEEDVAASLVEEPSSGVVFQLEREMQSAVRKQLGALESGLVEADGGSEMVVATGRVDIVAKDSKGDLVAIELKAGPCTPGALEQVLGYAQALEDEKGLPVRAFLVASSFPDRIRAAAKRTKGLELRTYEFTMQFKAVK